MAEVKQRFVMCPQGHSYDANQHLSCPYCSQGQAATGATGTAPAAAGGFGRTVAPAGAQAGYPGASSFGRTVTPNQTGAFGQTITPNQPGAFGQTVTPNQPAGASFAKTVVPNQQAAGQGATYDMNPLNARTTPAYPGQRIAASPATGSFGGGSADMQRTQLVGGLTSAQGSQAARQLPVVAWLVAVTGPCAGTDLRLHAGTNLIGRDASNDVCIRWDNTVSRQNNSMVTYNADERKFYLSHVTGHGPTKLNGRDVIGRDRELEAFDRLTIGSTDFVFVPLCGERFAWGAQEGSHA